ncbi:MAG: alpha-hydroxy acid oxidase [Pirellulaceae bacterium]
MTANNGPESHINHRREFLRFLATSPLLAGFAAPQWLLAASEPACEGNGRLVQDGLAEAKNVFEIRELGAQQLTDIALRYCDGGADDLKTVRANSEAFDQLQIRARRLVNVSSIDTSIEIFGHTLASPILACPVGFLQVFHDQGELAAAAACKSLDHQMMVSTLSSFPISQIATDYERPLWFQLYPTPRRHITTKLIDQARAAGCHVLMLTVDTPVIGNRENHAGYLTSKMASGELVAGNFVEMDEGIESLPDPTLDWDFVKWLQDRWEGPVVLKGIVTHEDAVLCLEHEVDGIYVSNHGGRQLESLRATIDCLPEIVEVVDGRVPIMIDGGFRRGTDIFKALSLGATAVAIGRPYLWGLAAGGQAGVERVLELLQAELVRDMQLAGTPDIAAITQNFVTRGR